MRNFDPAMMLLQVLLRGPGSGIELMSRIRQETNGHMSLSQTTAYDHLRAMEKEGLVKTVVSLRTKVGRPPRRFSLTPKGEVEAKRDRSAAAGMFADKKKTATK